MEPTDAELMSRLVAGDDLALNELMARWRDRVASFLFRMTSHSGTAADLTQETFVNLHQARHRYRPDGKFSAWLFTIAANVSRHHARWKSRHPTVSLDQKFDDGLLLAELIDPGQTPEEAAATSECLSAVHQAFQSLPADLREAMSLFIYEDMSYVMVATVTGCSAKAAEMRIYRARQSLKVQLKDIRS